MFEQKSVITKKDAYVVSTFFKYRPDQIMIRQSAVQRGCEGRGGSIVTSVLLFRTSSYPQYDKEYDNGNEEEEGQRWRGEDASDLTVVKLVVLVLARLCIIYVVYIYVLLIAMG